MHYSCNSCLAINLTLFTVSYDIAQRTPQLCDVQAKRRDDRPWCGDDVGALGLGAATASAMLGAISVAHHGWLIFWSYCEAAIGYLPYVGPTYGLV